MVHAGRTASGGSPLIDESVREGARCEPGHFVGVLEAVAA